MDQDYVIAKQKDVIVRLKNKNISLFNKGNKVANALAIEKRVSKVSIDFADLLISINSDLHEEVDRLDALIDKYEGAFSDLLECKFSLEDALSLVSEE